ncbi:MAG: SpoIIE family protein phosphatase, partial [Candidatus Korobacteraceae bacterium]
SPMASPISRRVPQLSAPSRPSALRYAILACLFVATTCLFVQSTKTTLHQAPINAPIFVPQNYSPIVYLVDAKAAAAGLHRGDILVAINHHPYTGMAVFWEALRKATPGSVLLVTVRSPQPNSPDRTIAFPVTARTLVIDSKPARISLRIVVPAFCFVLGFWVVMVRPRDLSAWLLLGLLLGLGETVSGYPAFDDWGPAALKVVYTYYLLIYSAMPALLFLFGFFFPEPLPFFARAGWWGKWLPWIVVIPYEIYSLVYVAVLVGGLTGNPSTQWLGAIFHSVATPIVLYELALVVAFFVFIVTKSVIAISPDAKRRLRLLYWGAAISMTPMALLAAAVYLKNTVDFADWIISLVVLAFLVFPVTLAYVIVVQRAMDVRVVLRQGLQYALARNGIRVLQFLAIGLVTVTAVALIGQNQKRPQKLIVIGIGLLAVFTIRQLSAKIGVWVDRRFFREAYDAEQVLSELSEGVRSMVEVRSLVRTVAERISETLHIPRVAVMLGDSGPYRPAYALGYGSAPDIVFPPGAGTVKVLARQPEPARVYFDDPHSWLYREPDVTEEDRSKLTQLDAELLLPLSARDKLLGFISLGPKLSDEPYSRTDLRLLKSVAAQTGLALENAQLISEIADEVAQRERLNSEVQIARDVQERLFPQTLPPIAGLAYAGACRSALGVGGDYYDFLALPGGKLGLAIGDVSGKGIAAALTMASLQASLRSEATRAPDNIAGLMSNVNRLLHEALASNRYATFFYGQYDPASRRLTYVNAGHNPPMLFHSSNGDCHVSRLEASGTVVGLLDNATYQQAAVPLAPGDVFIAFTDGISEAMNAAQDEWGEDRLIDTMKGCLKLPPGEIISCIMKSADNFAAGAKQNDDMTIIVLSAA